MTHKPSDLLTAFGIFVWILVGAGIVAAAFAIHWLVGLGLVSATLIGALKVK